MHSVTFLASLGGLDLEEKIPRSGSAVGAVAESLLSLKLLSLVVPGGK